MADNMKSPIEAIGEQASNLSWEASELQRSLKSEKLAWILGKIAIAVTVLVVIAFAATLPMRKVETRVVVVDKATGETTLAADIPSYVADRNDINDKHWIKRFVIARERYSYNILQADYDLVKRLAGDEVWNKYSKLWVGENSMQKKYAQNIEFVPTILSVTLPSPNIATVRYEVKETDLRNVSSGTYEPKVTRYVATLEYHYIPTPKNTPESEAIENPLGFAVTGYQVDPEIVVTKDQPTIPAPIDTSKETEQK